MFNTMHASHKDKEFYSHVCVTEYQNNNIMLKMYETTLCCLIQLERFEMIKIECVGS